ncbi:hypothetical protein T484DRAFT_1797381 [Baffinella frigidus]|nr:hypothetical protein T484DRAFT_1797381 [Cryptophyta sp. CCMP2293]
MRSFSLVVFGIIGKGLLGNKLYSCTTPGAEFPAGRLECAGLHVNDAGWMAPRSWHSLPFNFDSLNNSMLNRHNPPFNFDSLIESMLALFRVNTDNALCVARERVSEQPGGGGS